MMKIFYCYYFFIFLHLAFITPNVYCFDAIKSEAKTLPTMQDMLLSNPTLHTTVMYYPAYLKSFPAILQTQNIATLKTFVSKDQFINVLQKAIRLLNTPNHKHDFYEKSIHFSHDAVLHIFGDQHGSFHDTITGLNSIFYSQTKDQFSPFEPGSFHLKPQYKHHHWIFCGDLTDGGAYGVETLFVLLSVFLENPANIHLVRGNHEDINVNQRYGFLDEISLKFGSIFTSKITELLQKFYQSLPVALWGIFDKKQDVANADQNYSIILFCHGCIEPQDTNFIPFFKRAIQNGQAYKQVQGIFETISDLGYLWNDINKNEQYVHTRKDPFSGRTQLSQHDITTFMNTICKESEFSFDHIFRAHQHTLSYHDLMPIFFENNGICQFFHNKKPFLTTLLVMPCTFAGMPYQQDKRHFFPGITQIVPAVLYQKNKQTLYCDFLHLPNTHIPDIIFKQQSFINKVENQFSSSTEFGKKHDQPIVIRSIAISE